jgi:hypothetical protein
VPQIWKFALRSLKRLLPQKASGSNRFHVLPTVDALPVPRGLCKCYLVGGTYTYPSEKWWSESQSGWFSIPNIWKVIKFMFQTTNQLPSRATRRFTMIYVGRRVMVLEYCWLMFIHSTVDYFSP